MKEDDSIQGAKGHPKGCDCGGCISIRKLKKNAKTTAGNREQVKTYYNSDEHKHLTKLASRRAGLTVASLQGEIVRAYLAAHPV